MQLLRNAHCALLVLQSLVGIQLFGSGKVDADEPCCILAQAPYSVQPPEGSNWGSEPGSSAAQDAGPEGTDTPPDQATTSQSAEPDQAGPKTAHENASGQTHEATSAKGKLEDGEGDVYYDALEGMRTNIRGFRLDMADTCQEVPCAVSILLEWSSGYPP